MSNISSSSSTTSTSTLGATTGSPAAGLFQGPLRTIWNVQGENVVTLWWPAKDGASQSKFVLTGGSEPQQAPRTVLFMIPGNPGVIDYYIPFLQIVHDTCNGNLDIFGGKYPKLSSHLGHTSGAHVKDPSRLYTLQEQVDNKIAIFDALRERYPSNTRYVIAGHSMGAWLSLQLLKARPNHQIERIFGLFPTVHHILDTPNGQKLKNIFRPRTSSMIAGTVTALRFIFSAPPVLNGIVRLATGQDQDMAQVTAQQLLFGHVVKNCLFLAGQEMETIRELDEQLVHKHGHKFVFYYGKTDEWSPLEHYLDMRDRFPHVKSHLCSQGMKHAFVLGHGEAMGVLVGEWINEL
ncbi:hypothetical protein BGW42_005589 [Actinomortierella wolfii]|nr:hypothetical protein BGW42_005589 [Actinomortierella wolfii]